MGGFFGAALRHDAVMDVFFGVDYHSHLGNRRAGMAAINEEVGFQRSIHSIENSPFRTKFENIFDEMSGNSAIGCISDSDPQPLLMRSRLGTYAITMIGIINNADRIIRECLPDGVHFNAMTGGAVNSVELLSALINCKSTFAEGIAYAQSVIEGTVNVLILCEDGTLICARDKVGRIPVLLGKCEDGYCVSFESFAYEKLGYTKAYELGAGEIVSVSADGYSILQQRGEEMRICSFLWSYYGYPTSSYEGINVETMRYRNGEIMAENDRKNGFSFDIDFVAGIPDSGTPHAIGYANRSRIPFARPFIKYTPTWPRSFIGAKTADRKRVAKMKMVPVHELIAERKLLFVDDSIVRGTQLKETVDFLYDNGAASVHMRSACPPIMHSCKFLNFTRSTSEMDLIARRTVMELEGEEGYAHLDEYSDGSTERGRRLREAIAEKLHFATLDFQSLDGVIRAIGIDPCKLCTYCWNGKE